MRVWLAISGMLFALWAGILSTSPELLLGPQHANRHAAVVVVVAAGKLILALIAWWSAFDPPRRRSGIYLTILALLAKWIADTYGVLVALPADQAALVLGDLLLTVALVVGCLESLPRTLGAHASS